MWIADTTNEVFIHNIYDHGNTMVSQGKEKEVETMTRNRNGTVYAVSFRDRSVRFYGRNGEPIGPGIATPVVAKSIDVSPNGNLVATSCSQTYPVVVWNTATSEQVAIFHNTNDTAPIVRFVGNDKLAVLEAVNSSKSWITIYNVKTGRRLKRWSIGSSSWDLTVSPNEERIATLSGPESPTLTAVRVWDLKGKLVKKIADKEVVQTTVIFDPVGGLMIGDAASTVRSYVGRQYRFLDATTVAESIQPVKEISVDHYNFRVAVNTGTRDVTFWNR